MTQNEFFNILIDGLKEIPEIQLQEIISYYDRNFTLGLATGKTEEEIVHELGDPNSIVNKYRNENFKIEDNPISNSSNSKNDLKDDVELKYLKTTDSHENINLDNDFYNLHSYNISSDNREFNSQPIASCKSENNFNANDNFNYNRSSSYNSSNNNYSREDNSNSSSSNYTNQVFNGKMSKSNVNAFLRFCIAILALIIFFPVITGVIGFVIGIFGVAVSIFIASIGVLVGGTFTSFMGLPNVPAFVANFPYPVIVLFSLGSICLSILLTLLFYYLCKFFIRLFIKIYDLIKEKGGAF